MGIAIAGLIASIIAGVASYANQRKQIKTANQNVDKTISANRSMAEYGYSKDLEMWNKANEYNSPEAQQLRLSKAGLNPNLVYGSGTVAGNTSGQMPRFNAPTAEYNYQAEQMPGEGLGSMISQFQDMSMRQAQIDNVKAQTKAVGQRTVNDSITERLLGLQEYGMPYKNAMLGTQARFAESMAEYGLEAKRMNVRMGQTAIQKMMSEMDVNKMQMRLGGSREQIQSEDLKMKRFQNEWMKSGVTGKDNILMRMLFRQFPSLFDSVPDIWNSPHPAGRIFK